MIKYDEFGLIVQHRPDEPDYADGGDSCMRTSIAVLSGITRANLTFFFKDGLIVRHPFQKEYCDPKETSRDQLIPWLSAMFAIEYRPKTNYKLFINKDFLGLPHIQWFIRTVSGENCTNFLTIGKVFMVADIKFMCKYKPDHELNQAYCIALTLDRAYGTEFTKLICNKHPDWRKNLRDYYCGWRDQSELGEAFIQRIEQEL